MMHDIVAMRTECDSKEENFVPMMTENPLQLQVNLFWGRLIVMD